MRIRLSRSVLLAVILFLSGSATAGTRYVNGPLATGNNDGTSWADAYRGVDAVAVALTASIAGDEIWVAAGTYEPTTTTMRTISHELKRDVAVYGGFNGTETALSQRDYRAYVTVLSGDIGAEGLISDNSFHVVYGGNVNAGTILDGFTVMSGNANDTLDATEFFARGGGLLLWNTTPNSPPKICNVRFTGNRSTSYGGAVYLWSSNASFDNTSFHENSAGMVQGGGAIGSSIIVSSAFTTLDRCTFVRNSAGFGGAVYASLGGSLGLRIINSVFLENVATNLGGGGAIYGSSGARLTIRNCTIVQNGSTTSGAGGIQVSAGPISTANCIVWDNSGPGGSQSASDQVSGPANVTYSIVEGGIAGTGNLNVDPLFANAPANDFSLTIASPAIDAGNNASVISGFQLDIAGNPRFTDEPTVADTGAGVAPIVDIGAYEFPVPLVTAICTSGGAATPCPCGNDAPVSSGRGCLNSLGTGGLLASAGSARILSDTFVLLGSGMPNSSCLYFQGTEQVNGGSGTLFGDGILCVGGSVTRLGTKANSAGGSQYPAIGEQSISAMGMVTTAGSTRVYQCWYRNAAPFCSVETFNLTNGLSVTWEL